MTGSPVASVYVLEGADELVLEVRMLHPRGDRRSAHEGRAGITGTCVESMSPVTVNDARLSEQFEYFPQLARSGTPAFSPFRCSPARVRAARWSCNARRDLLRVRSAARHRPPPAR